MNVIVASYTDAISAHIVRGRLEEEGIPVDVVNEHHVWANWLISQALGGVQLQVPLKFQNVAYETLNKIETGLYQDLLEEVEPSSPEHTCPRCKSEKTEQFDLLRRWALLFTQLQLFLAPIPFTRHLIRCRTCSKYWIATDDRPYYFSTLLFAIFMVPISIFTVGWLLYALHDVLS